MADFVGVTIWPGTATPPTPTYSLVDFVGNDVSLDRPAVSCFGVWDYRILRTKRNLPVIPAERTLIWTG